MSSSAKINLKQIMFENHAIIIKQGDRKSSQEGLLFYSGNKVVNIGEKLINALEILDGNDRFSIEIGHPVPYLYNLVFFISGETIDDWERKADYLNDIFVYDVDDNGRLIAANPIALHQFFQIIGQIKFRKFVAQKQEKNEIISIKKSSDEFLVDESALNLDYLGYNEYEEFHFSAMTVKSVSKFLANKEFYKIFNILKVLTDYYRLSFIFIKSKRELQVSVVILTGQHVLKQQQIRNEMIKKNITMNKDFSFLQLNVFDVVNILLRKPCEAADDGLNLLNNEFNKVRETFESIFTSGLGEFLVNSQKEYDNLKNNVFSNVLDKFSTPLKTPGGPPMKIGITETKISKVESNNEQTSIQSTKPNSIGLLSEKHSILSNKLGPNFEKPSTPKVQPVHGYEGFSIPPVPEISEINNKLSNKTIQPYQGLSENKTKRTVKSKQLKNNKELELKSLQVESIEEDSVLNIIEDQPMLGEMDKFYDNDSEDIDFAADEYRDVSFENRFVTTSHANDNTNNFDINYENAIKPSDYGLLRIKDEILMRFDNISSMFKFQSDYLILIPELRELIFLITDESIYYLKKEVLKSLLHYKTTFFLADDLNSFTISCIEMIRSKNIRNISFLNYSNLNLFDYLTSVIKRWLNNSNDKLAQKSHNKHKYSGISKKHQILLNESTFLNSSKP
jgi:hypothetical protein